MKILLTPNEYNCGIVDLYKNIGKRLGYDDEKVESYDCTHLSIDKAVADSVEEYCKKELKMTNEGFGMAWVVYGPKASLTTTNGEVEVEDGFLILKGE